MNRDKQSGEIVFTHSRQPSMAVCEVISRFLHILVNRLMKIRKCNSPYLFDERRKSVFYLGVGEHMHVAGMQPRISI